MRAPPRGTLASMSDAHNTKLANAGSKAATFPARHIEASTPSRPLPRLSLDLTPIEPFQGVNLLAYRDAWLMRAANVAPAASVS